MKLSQQWWLHVVLTLPMGAVGALHIIQAIMVLTDGVGTTSIIGLSASHPGDWVPIAIGETPLAICYISFAVLAFVGVAWYQGPFAWHILTWMPQQLLMVFAAMSAAEAMWRGHYLDGTGAPGSGIIISQQHIIADQALFGITAVIHFLAFIGWRYIVARIEAWEADSERQIVELDQKIAGVLIGHG